MNAPAPARLTLGPLLFHWPPKRRRDFYHRIADEAPVDAVYLGEVVCSKREPQFGPFFADVAARLRTAGKEVVISTLALVTTAEEIAAIRDAAAGGALLEANDVACVQLLAGAPHVVGPYINVFNEGARDFLVARGAVRIVLPVEMPLASMRTVAAAAAPTAFEVQVYGRQPLSVAMRCYHARSHALTKDHCQLVCGLDADGMTATTVDGVEILTINGTQTLSHGYGVLLAELGSLREAGVTHFRLSPQNLDMVRVAKLYRDLLDGRLGAADALPVLRSMSGDVPFVNGFLHGREGMRWL
ncbi:MAG TPA: U32 family peptidase [Steroidobacteraceae bacterium]|nr:U32 family peptidase [Steroidobacteraceae bacterium]